MLFHRHLAAGLLAATLTGTAVVAAAAWQRQDKVELRAVRFFTPASGQTSVLAMIQVPYMLATPVGEGGAAHLAYTVNVRIVDDQGKEYAKESFQRRAAASFRVPGAAGMEDLRFLAKGGKYHMIVGVTDSASGRTTSDTLHIDAFGDSPAASDLLLANSMRIAPAEDTSSLPGETARGSYRFTTAPVVRIDLTHPNIAFMIEAYPAQDVTSSLTFSVRTPDGKVMAPLPPIASKVAAGGGVLKGQFSLEGLPSGAYVLHASLKLGSQTIERSTPFAVTEENVALTASMASANSNRGSDEAYFNSLPEDSLDAAAEVLTLSGAPKQETDVYKKEGMTLAAKRQFLIQFWQRHDLTKGTPENEERMRFYSQVAYANKNFGERGRQGWKTDRGRVYARFGAPTDSLARSNDGKAPPYLVWQYNKGKSSWFIFADRSNSNQYTLLKSNANGFPGNGSVIETLTLEVSEHIAVFLGLDQCYFRKLEQLGGSSQITNSTGVIGSIGSTSMTCN